MWKETGGLEAVVTDVIRSWDYDRILRGLRKLSPRALLLSFLMGFFLASLLSVFFGLLLMPDQTQTLPPKSAEAGQPPQALANLGTQATLSKEELDLILKRNIFNSTGELGDGADNVPKNKAGDSSQAVLTSLPLKLHGLIFGGTPYSGLATIEDTSKKKIDSYVVGDAIMRNVKVLEIYPERVIIDNEGAREFIEIEKLNLVRSSRRKGPAGGTSPGEALSSGPAPITSGPPPDSYKEEGFERKGASIVVNDSFKRDMLGPKMTKVLQDAKAVPNMVNGELKGFRLERIREDSVYLKAGFQNGDIVEEINGVPLKDAAGAIRLLQQLRNEKEMEVRVNRGGATFNMHITVQ